MNMNYNYLTAIFRSILTQVYVFLVLFTIFHFDLEKFISKNSKYIFFYQKFVHLGKYNSKYFSRMIVVHVHATVFFKKKRLISMLRIAQKPMLGRKVIHVRCINLSYNNMAIGIRLLDNKALFVYTGKFSCKLELLKDIAP